MPRQKSPLNKALKPAHLQAIGRVAAEWAALELLIQTLIADVTALDQVKSLILTTPSGIHGWKDMLRNMLLFNYNDTAVEKELKTVYKKIDELHTARNSIVHATWFIDSAKGFNKHTAATGFGLPKRGKSFIFRVTKTASEMRQIANEIELIRGHLYYVVARAIERASKRRLLAQALLASGIPAQPNQGTLRNPHPPSRE